MRGRPLTDAQIRALPPIPKSGRRDLNTCGAGLLIVNEPVVRQKPCLRFVYSYFQIFSDGMKKIPKWHWGLTEKVAVV